MSRIDRSEVERIAALARLRLAPGDAEALGEALSRILDHVEQLESVDLEGVEPTVHGTPVPTPLRPDRVEPSLDPRAAVANAPEKEGTAFAVPPILAGEVEG